MQIQTFDPTLKGWTTPANDGRVLIEMDDGRTFTIRKTDGVLTLTSNDGELLLHPISRTEIEIDTPIT